MKASYVESIASIYISFGIGIYRDSRKLKPKKRQWIDIYKDYNPNGNGTFRLRPKLIGS